ncbi:MAG: hypothetical protein ACXWMU_06755, partial [Candidatus Limnocylindrales bacterium]
AVLKVVAKQLSVTAASTPARSSRPTRSSLIGGTGATNGETPADGWGLKRPADHMCVTDVATQDNGRGERI